MCTEETVPRRSLGHSLGIIEKSRKLPPVHRRKLPPVRQEMDIPTRDGSDAIDSAATRKNEKERGRPQEQQPGAFSQTHRCGGESHLRNVTWAVRLFPLRSHADRKTADRAGPWDQGMCRFPVAAVTNGHTRGDLTLIVTIPEAEA